MWDLIMPLFIFMSGMTIPFGILYIMYKHKVFLKV